MADENKAVKLDVETSLYTIEGRIYLKQLNEVSRVLSFSDTEVRFWGEEKVKTGYVSDCKSVHLFECPNGFFILCNKASTKNNWSAIGKTANEVLEKLYDPEIKKKLEEELAGAVA